MPTTWEFHFAFFSLTTHCSVVFDLHVFLLFEMKILKYYQDEELKRLKEFEILVEKLHCRPAFFL